MIRMARHLERAAYRNADHIVVLSEAFTENLLEKGVPRGKIELIYDPATRTPLRRQSVLDEIQTKSAPPRLLSMGNIGYSQGLAPLVAAFERSEELKKEQIQFAITGNGVAAGDTRSEIRSDRVQMLGVVDDHRLEHELESATIALVSQSYEGAEFNIPSKIMNFMAYGLPILAAVNPRGEVARIVTRSGAGWVVDSSQPDAFPHKLVEILRSPGDIQTRGDAAYQYAQDHFMPPSFINRFDNTLTQMRDGSREAQPHGN